MQYEQMKRGWTKELTDAQREEIMVDFESKYLDALESGELSADDGEDEQPLVEITDEFGRSRMVKQTRVTRALSPDRELRPYHIYQVSC